MRRCPRRGIDPTLRQPSSLAAGRVSLPPQTAHPAQRHLRTIAGQTRSFRTRGQPDRRTGSGSSCSSGSSSCRINGGGGRAEWMEGVLDEWLPLRLRVREARWRAYLSSTPNPEARALMTSSASLPI